MYYKGFNQSHGRDMYLPHRMLNISSKQRANGSSDIRGTYFNTPYESLSGCQRQSSPSKIINTRSSQSHQKHFQFVTKNKQGHSGKSLVQYEVSAALSRGMTVSVTVSVCKQCRLAEIGPPMGFLSTKNTINGFWPNLSMMSLLPRSWKEHYILSMAASGSVSKIIQSLIIHLWIKKNLKKGGGGREIV